MSLSKEAQERFQVELGKARRGTVGDPTCQWAYEQGLRDAAEICSNKIIDEPDDLRAFDNGCASCRDAILKHVNDK